MQLFRNKLLSLIVLFAILTAGYPADSMSFSICGVKIKAPNPPKIRDIANIITKPVGDVAKTALIPAKFAGKAAKEAGIFISDAKNDVLNETVNIAGKLGGNTAENLVKTVTDPVRIVTEPATTVVIASGNILEGKDIIDSLHPAGLLLASTLRAAKKQYEPEAKPLPKDIKEILKPFFSSKVLSKAKYTVNVMRISIPGACNIFFESLNRNNAVCADNIIIFSTDPGNNIFWWAHEIQHIVQYQRLEIEGFASEYAKHMGLTLEADADRKAREVCSKSNRVLAQAR